ncbi:MAG: biotin--[Prevotella sp.]|nr:biotin--[acetyl-CoA-carboxylase] ligase [Prevotella sp.]
MKTRIISIKETDSTNRKIKEQAVDEDAMTVLVAERQTAGKGCGTNSWESEPHKNLTFSIRYCPEDVEARRQFVISMQISVAIHRAMMDFGVPTTIKWPNDIYWNDKKLAGILIENQLQGSHIRDSIIGIGLNVNQRTFLSDAPNPVSMSQILSRHLQLNEILQRIIFHFQNAEKDIAAVYRSLLYRKTGMHEYSDSKGNFIAEIVGVADDGLLSLRDSRGVVRKYAFKEVAFII